MLAEVERMQQIETLEESAHLKHIKVPHPYLHHREEKIQCYGMEFIDGADLQELLDGTLDFETYQTIKEQVLGIPQEELLAELRRFLRRMHTYCLHGDIKPKNYMVDKNGQFYLIDFGQSVLKATDVPNEAAMEQYDNLTESEIESTKTIIRMLYRKLQQT